MANTSTLTPTSISTKTQEALLHALADEREAEDAYAAVLAAYGNIRPFCNIIEAERRHQQELIVLFDRYGLAVPKRQQSTATAPDSIFEACRRAVDAEVRNVAMFDALIEGVEEEDIRETFLRLQEASRDRHLPAFRRCMGRSHGAR